MRSFGLADSVFYVSPGQQSEGEPLSRGGLECVPGVWTGLLPPSLVAQHWQLINKKKMVPIIKNVFGGVQTTVNPPP